MIKYKKPENLVELIDQICARPGAFVGKADVDLVGSFIFGFVFAREGLGNVDDSDEMSAFGEWLVEKFDLPRNWLWVMTIKEYYHDDEKALDMLPKLFKEFQETR